jgi:hypothetical protein
VKDRQTSGGFRRRYVGLEQSSGAAGQTLPQHVLQAVLDYVLTKERVPGLEGAFGVRVGDAELARARPLLWWYFVTRRCITKWVTLVRMVLSGRELAAPLGYFLFNLPPQILDIAIYLNRRRSAVSEQADLRLSAKGEEDERPRMPAAVSSSWPA